jgi:hypothetical protein
MDKRNYMDPSRFIYIHGGTREEFKLLSVSLKLGQRAAVNLVRISNKMCSKKYNEIF